MGRGCTISISKVNFCFTFMNLIIVIMRGIQKMLEISIANPNPKPNDPPILIMSINLPRKVISKDL